MAASKKVYGFFHFYYSEMDGIIIRWIQILEEMFYSIKFSGLLDNTEKLYVGIVGIKEDHPNSKIIKNLFKNQNNVKLVFFGDGNLYEFPTLNLIYEKCLNEDCYIYYCHSKGASYRPNRGLKQIIRVEHWRWKMILTTIINWRRCISLLEQGYKTCGYQRDKRKKLKNTYAGNFFWADSSHIKSLPKPEMKKDRFDAEHWIDKMKNPYADIHFSEESLHK